MNMHWTFYDFVGTKSTRLVLGIKCSGMAVSWQNFKNFTPSKAIVLLVWCLTLIYKTKTSYSKESASKKNSSHIIKRLGQNRLMLLSYSTSSFPVRSKICGFFSIYILLHYTKINSGPTK